MPAAGIRGTRFLAIGEPKAKTELRTAGRGPHCERERVRGDIVILLKQIKNGRRLTLLVNHWKSMSGGAGESEVWRAAQESLLADRMEELGGIPAIACGDFNRDVQDFAGGDDGIVILRSGEKGVAARSPWLSADGGHVGPGSYYYKEEWSRIDGFLCAGRLELEDFRPETGGPWCQEDTKIPKKYKVWNGQGYSDHLPISCTVRF